MKQQRVWRDAVWAGVGALSAGMVMEAGTAPQWTSSNALPSGANSGVFAGTENAASGENAVVGGGDGNLASGYDAGIWSGQSGIAGGDWSFIGAGYYNTASGAASAIGGGKDHDASGVNAYIGGGEENAVSGENGAICGGGNNLVSGDYGAIAGGVLNTVSDTFAGVMAGSENLVSERYGLIGGGEENRVTGSYSTVLNGYQNVVMGSYSAVLGGRNNTTAASYTLAFGREVSISEEHPGAMLLADSSSLPFSSVRLNEFAVRATGGVRFVTAIDDTGVPTGGVMLPAGGGGWLVQSDRDSKEDFQSVDSDEVLERIAELDIPSWRYRAQVNPTRHIGPMAQDFYASFDVGEDPRHINTVDADGVALVAIQGLLRRLEVQERRLSQLEADNTTLKNTLRGLGGMTVR